MTSSSFINPSSPPASAPGVQAVARHQPQTCLLQAVRTVVRADSDPARQALFAHVVRSRRLVRLVLRVHDQFAGTWASAVLISGYGAAAFFSVAPPSSRRARLLAVAGHENARRQIARVFGWVNASDCDWLRTQPGVAFGSALMQCAGLLRPRRLVRVLRIIRAIDRRHGFLVACRSAATLGWYARARTILAGTRGVVVLVSSDSNPEEEGVLAAARALGVPQVFVSHAYPTPFAPPLDFSLSILEGEAAVQARRRSGPIRGAVLLAGFEGPSAPFDVGRIERERPVVGIFPPKAFSWSALADIIGDCRTHFRARRIVIRWHPSMLEPSRLALVVPDLTGITVSSASASLAHVAGECDWVVAAENSNVHLPVLRLGLPTVAVKGLGLYPEHRADLYGFVANGVIFPPLPRLRDLDVVAFRRFFATGWDERFRQYDASYGQPADAAAPAVRHAIEALLNGALSPAAS